MKEFLVFAKDEFMAAKWYDKLWTIFQILGFMVALFMMVFFILFESIITIKVMFLFLWTVMMVAIGMLIGVLLD